tara:strand:+ start:140 stop:277 length:138 start_codon:yes stop_codon:yes gene_type:complete
LQNENAQFDLYQDIIIIEKISFILNYFVSFRINSETDVLIKSPTN